VSGQTSKLTNLGVTHAGRGSLAPTPPPHTPRAAVGRTVIVPHAAALSTHGVCVELSRRGKQIMDDIGDYLRYLFQTDSKYTAAISGCVRWLWSFVGQWVSDVCVPSPVGCGRQLQTSLVGEREYLCIPTMIWIE